MKFIEKKWGGEYWIEVNPKYTMKKLIMKAGHRCSLQKHAVKHESLYVLSGKLKFTIGSDINSLEEKILIPGDSYVIEPGIIHRMEGIEDSEYLECSTSELDDVIRLEDDYGRV